MEDKETPSLEKDISVNIQPVSIHDPKLHTYSNRQSWNKELSPSPSSTGHRTWNICFPPHCQPSGYGWNDTHPSPFPRSVTDPLRKLSPSPYLAGRPLLSPQNRKRGRECSSTRKTQREPRMGPSGAFRGTPPPEVPGISAGNRNPDVLHTPLGSFFVPKACSHVNSQEHKNLVCPSHFNEQIGNSRPWACLPGASGD